MNKLSIVDKVFAIAAVAVTFAGCTTMTPEEQRAAYQEEFSRLAALPPAEKVVSPNSAIDSCAKLSCDLFNEVQPMMKAYVSQVENFREYTAFMNEIKYCVEEEKLSEDAACKKVADAVTAADANRPADQKVWPKIKAGIDAANALEPKKQLAQLATLVARNTQIVSSVNNLPQAFASEDFMGKAKRASECAAISKQSGETLKCLNYLMDQYNRVSELDEYVRNR